ncbi:nonstructural protein 3 [Galliform chaphamaparvovirus 8]|nr:nonstructural protein 3 [Galliform chaphamaparvovirus 8]
MASFGNTNGFTLLVWVDPDSWRLQNLSDEQRNAKIREMVEDATVLLCGRWGMESTIMEVGENTYAFFCCTRFVVGTPTIIRALGSLADSIKFHRGGPTDKPELLIKYKECLQKYQVPEKVSNDYSSEEYGASQSGLNWNAAKRSRQK